MITGNIAMPRITGNMKAQRADHFHGKLVGAARRSLRSRISSLKARKASPTLSAEID